MSLSPELHLSNIFSLNPEFETPEDQDDSNHEPIKTEEVLLIHSLPIVLSKITAFLDQVATHINIAIERSDPGQSPNSLAPEAKAEVNLQMARKRKPTGKKKKRDKPLPKEERRQNNLGTFIGLKVGGSGGVKHRRSPDKEKPLPMPEEQKKKRRRKKKKRKRKK